MLHKILKKNPENVRSKASVQKFPMVIGSTLFLLQLISGLLYLSYDLWSLTDIFLSLRAITYIHVIGVFCITTCFIIHLTKTILPQNKNPLQQLGLI